VAQRLGLDKNTVYKYLQDGTFPGLQLGRKWLVSERRLVEFLDDADRRQTRQRRNAASSHAPLPGAELMNEAARAVIDAAREEARLLNHDHIGTEHLLIALTREPDSLACHTLARLGVDVVAVAESARAIVEPGPPLTATAVSFTPRVKSVLALAVDEAGASGSAQVGPEHLLIAILAAGEGMACTVLTRAGVTLQSARSALHDISGAP
jgi:excisionase family DNA binding protein